ncbi:phosphopantetheine-binding protein [Streptomyces sp. 900105755]
MLMTQPTAEEPILPGIPGAAETEKRLRALLGQVLGYPLDPEIRNLQDLDSLQILELIVLLEEEFDIDSDKITESEPGWWSSVDDLVASIRTLMAASSSTAASRSTDDRG